MTLRRARSGRSTRAWPRCGARRSTSPPSWSTRRTAPRQTSGPWVASYSRCSAATKVRYRNHTHCLPLSLPFSLSLPSSTWQARFPPPSTSLTASALSTLIRYFSVLAPLHYQSVSYPREGQRRHLLRKNTEGRIRLLEVSPLTFLPWCWLPPCLSVWLFMFPLLYPWLNHPLAHLSLSLSSVPSADLCGRRLVLRVRT